MRKKKEPNPEAAIYYFQPENNGLRLGGATLQPALDCNQLMIIKLS